MIPCLDAEKVVTPVVVQGLARGGMGTPGLCGAAQLAMGVIVAQRGAEALSRMACASMVLRAVLLPHRRRPPWPHGTTIRMEERRPQPLGSRGARAVAVCLGQARVPVDSLGGARPGASKGYAIMAVSQPQECTCLPTLALSQDERARRAQGRRRNGSEALPHPWVTGRAFHTRDGRPMAVCLRFVKAEQGGGVESKQGKRRQQRLVQGHLPLVNVLIRDGGAVRMQHAEERIGPERLARPCGATMDLATSTLTSSTGAIVPRRAVAWHAC